VSFSLWFETFSVNIKYFFWTKSEDKKMEFKNNYKPAASDRNTI